MKNRITAFAIWAAIALGVIGLAFAASDAYWSSDQNGRLWSLKSGGEINIESGAALKFAGTQFTPSDYAPLAGADFSGTITVTDNGLQVLSLHEPASTIQGQTDNTKFFIVYSGDELEIALTDESDVLIGNLYISETTGLKIGSGAGAPIACVTVQDVRWCGAVASAPYVCDGGDPVGYYTDTTGPDLCYCNASAWAPADGSGTCA